MDERGASGAGTIGPPTLLLTVLLRLSALRMLPCKFVALGKGVALPTVLSAGVCTPGTCLRLPCNTTQLLLVCSPVQYEAAASKTQMCQKQ